VIRTRRRLLGMLTAILAATLTSLLLAASALADTATPEEPVSPNASAIDDIYLVILGATVTIFVLVGGFLLYSAIRFRERPGDPDPPQTHGSTKLELGWTIVPILIVLGIAGYTLYKLPNVDDTPNDAMKVHVLAQQFAWSFEYPDGVKPKSTAANTLRQFQTLCAVLGRPDIPSDRTLLPKLPDSADGFLSDLGNSAVRNELVKAFAADSAAAWEEKLAAAGVPASKVQTVPAYLDGHYLQSGRADVELDAHPLGRGTPARIFNEGFRWTGEPRARPGRPPRLGEHTAAVLDELSHAATDRPIGIRGNR